MFNYPVLYDYAKNKPAAVHSNVTEPSEWFNYLPQNYNGFSFDFFVDWSRNPPTLSPEIWIKLIVDIIDFNATYPDNPWPTADANAIVDQIVATETAPKLNFIESFAARYNLNSVYKIFDDNTDWDLNPNHILSVDLTNNQLNNMRYDALVDLQNSIRNLSGGAVRIGSKGLNLATSKLERYLSKTDSLWPGDCDFLLFENDLPIAIIEFKKNTQSPLSQYHRPIINESLENYYSTQTFKADNRKYNRLAVLKDYLGQDLPIIIIYYPVWIDKNPAGNIIKMEKVIGGFENLAVSGSYTTPIPQNTPASKEQFIQQLINFI